MTNSFVTYSQGKGYKREVRSLNTELLHRTQAGKVTVYFRFSIDLQGFCFVFNPTSWGNYNLVVVISAENSTSACGNVGGVIDFYLQWRGVVKYTEEKQSNLGMFMFPSLSLRYTGFEGSCP